MKSTVSGLALALAASATLLSTAGAAWPTAHRAPQAITNAVAAPETNYDETPAWADSFVDSIGFDSKFANHTYPPLVTTWLEWSHIRHLRESGAPSALNIKVYGDLGRHGIKHSIGLLRGFNANDLVTTLKAFAPYVDYVEPANEADNFKDPSWNQMRSDQARLWSIVRSNSAWSTVAVGGPSFASPKAHAGSVGPLDRYENFGQLHNGTCDWNPGVTNNASIDYNTALIRVTTVYKPIWTTESGYDDNPSRGCSLPDSTIAKYLTRTSAERWLHGEPRTYFDVLVDNPKDVVFGFLGVLHSNGTPKAQFIALGSLARLLADPGTAPRPTRVSYSLTGTTPDVHHILLRRRDGTYDLMLYRELPCWDHYKHASIPISTLSVNLSVSGMKHLSLYKYNTSYGFTSSTLAIGNNYKSVAFPVTDAISVLHFGF